jgi:hypothetical protein
MAEELNKSPTLPDTFMMVHLSVLPISIAVNVPDPEKGSGVKIPGMPAKLKLKVSALELCVQRIAKAKAPRAREKRFIELLWN